MLELLPAGLRLSMIISLGSRKAWVRLAAAGLAGWPVCAFYAAQNPAPPAQAPPAAAAEIATHDSAFTFHSRVNLVSVPVVVRDAQGRAIGDLAREDFLITDNGKPQVVSKFAVERFGQSVEVQADPAAPQAGAATAAPAMPSRFVAFLFDDVNLTFGDLVQSREAAWRFMQNSVRPAERVAIATTSGLTTLDFTSDRDRLHQTLLAIRTRPAIEQSSIDCPPMSVYEADRLYNKHDPDAMTMAVSDVRVCTSTPQMSVESALHIANQAAIMKLQMADRNIRDVMSTLDATIRKLSVMAGQRTGVMVSPGFLMTDDRRQDETDVFERAIHANVVVNALDARGLYANVGAGDASEHIVNTATIEIKSRFGDAAAMAGGEVMAETASATGGRFFQNSNDLDMGFERVAAAPEFLYVLGFNPQELKLDGKFHSLKVSLKNRRGVSLEARRGYYAPRFAADSAERAKQEVEEAFFSREETHDLAVTVQTQFFKTAVDKATLAVLAKVDLKQLPFRKADGRNLDNLTVVAGVFDSDGNFVSGFQKVIEMRLRDETFQARLNSGITVRNTFDLTPGAYLIRLVVRDSEGQSMASQNATVEIP